MCLGCLLSIYNTIKAWIMSWFAHKIIFSNTNIIVYIDSKTILGEGGFSQVKLGIDASQYHTKYALKRMLLQSSEDENNATQEIKYLQLFQHPNIVKFIDYLYAKENNRKVLYLLFPLISKGTLRHRLNAILEGQSHAFALPQLIHSYSLITSAIALLHHHSPAYVHRDIKPENVLLDDNDVPLLTDFGSVGRAETQINSRSDALMIIDEAARLSTLPYRAPELFDPVIGSSIDTRTDIWALGCLFYAYQFGYSPFECAFNQTTSVPYVVESSYLRILGKIPSPPKPSKQELTVLELVKWMLVSVPDFRPTTSEVINRLTSMAKTYGATGSEVDSFGANV